METVLCFSCYERNQIENINCKKCGVQLRDKEPEIVKLPANILSEFGQADEKSSFSRSMGILILCAILSGIALNILIQYFQYLDQNPFIYYSDSNKTAKGLRALLLLQGIFLPFVFLYNVWARRGYIIVLIFQIMIISQSYVFFYFLNYEDITLLAPTKTSPAWLGAMMETRLTFYIFLMTLGVLFALQIYILVFDKAISKKFGIII